MIYLDDGFLLDSSHAGALNFCSEAQRTLVDAGLSVNLEKSSLFPSQCLEWLGILIDSSAMLFRTPQRKIEKLLDLLQSACASSSLSPRQVARIAGKLVSLELALGPLTHLLTRQMYSFIGVDPVWDLKRPFGLEVRQEFVFWVSNLPRLDGSAVRLDEARSTILSCDASASGYGGLLSSDSGTEAVRGRFTDQEAKGSSTFRELLAIMYSLDAVAPFLKGRRVTVYSDSNNAVRIIGRGSRLSHLQEIAMSIFALSIKNSFVLFAVWIPRVENQIADQISKLSDSDGWAIDLETFEHIESKFGRFTVDRFADNLNYKVECFNSRFFCPGTSQVDAFASSWCDGFNWLCPPIKLIGRAIRHLQVSGGRGVLFVPEWRSAYFWPLLTNDGLYFRPCIKDFLLLQPYFFSNCSGRSVFSGFTNFRCYALLMDFSD